MKKRSFHSEPEPAHIESVVAAIAADPDAAPAL
jgi:hypothetical protein